jgi:hypothetical protein
VTRLCWVNMVGIGIWRKDLGTFPGYFLGRIAGLMVGRCAYADMVLRGK